MILRELHAIRKSAQRFGDGWCMISCIDETTASKVSKRLFELGYEVQIEEKAEVQRIRFRRVGKVGAKC